MMRSFASVLLIASAMISATPAVSDALAATTSSAAASAVSAPAVAAAVPQIPSLATPVAATPVAATPTVPSAEPPPTVEVAKPVAKPSPRVIARIDLTSQRMTVSIDGNSTHSWAISSGREGFHTPRGTFRPQWSAKMWYSRKYDDAPMPHAVFFNGGVAAHATSATGLLGSPASHGCVRLSPANAAAFYGIVHKHGYGAVRIIVQGTTPSSAIARRNRDRTDQLAYVRSPVTHMPRHQRTTTYLPPRPMPPALQWPGSYSPYRSRQPVVIYRPAPSMPHGYRPPVRTSLSR